MTPVFDTPPTPAVTLLPDGPKPDLAAIHERLGSLFTRLAIHRDERALLRFRPVTERSSGATVQYRAPGISFDREGATWSTSQSDRSTVAAMLRSVAQTSKGAVTIQVDGTPAFCRRAWLLGSAQGLAIKGHEPTAKDHQLMTRLAERWQELAPNHGKSRQPDPRLEGPKPGQNPSATHTSLAPGFDPSSLTQAGPPKPKQLPAVIRTPGRGR